MNQTSGSVTVSDHYAALAKKGKKARPKSPELPFEAVHIWNHFVRLSGARTGNGFGANPISFSEMDAYSRLCGWAFDPWEIDAIRLLDDAYLSISAEQSSKG